MPRSRKGNRNVEGARFLNVDLDVWGTEDLEPLAAAFGARCLVLHVGKIRRRFVLRVEAARPFSSPEATIRALLRVVQTLPRGSRTLWRRAQSRVFDIGYEAASQPHGAPATTLPPQLLRAIADVDASIAITIYPPAT